MTKAKDDMSRMSDFELLQQSRAERGRRRGVEEVKRYARPGFFQFQRIVVLEPLGQNLLRIAMIRSGIDQPESPAFSQFLREGFECVLDRQT